MGLTRHLFRSNCVASWMKREKGKKVLDQWFTRNQLGSRIVLTSCLLLFVILFSNPVPAQSLSPNAAQWDRVGGRIVARGIHEFQPSDPASGIFKGAFTVRGPGYIGVVSRKFKSISPGVGLRDSSGRGFISRYLGSQDLLKGADGNWRWYPPSMITEDYIPNANKGGWVPAPTMDQPTTTLEVWVTVEGGGIQNDERAIQYEFWFFPLEGGQVIATAETGKLDTPSDDNQNENAVRLAPVADNHVYAYSYRGWNRANWGKYENLGAGWNPIGGEKRAFLRFDLTGIAPNSVNKATLRLYHHHTGGGNAVNLGVYRLMSPWREGNGTYHSGQVEQPAAPGESSWVNQPAIDRYPVVYFNPGQDINKWVEVDVTSLVKAWLTGVPNHGMAVKGGEHLSGKPESQYGFASREFKDMDKRPQLILSRAGGQHEPQSTPYDGRTEKDNGRPWVIGSTNGIHLGTGSAWAEQPGGGRGKDIAVDGSGRPWVIGTYNGIHYHDGNRWIQYPGGGKGYAIDVSADGTPWVIGLDQGIYYHDGTRWIQYPGGGKGFDIAVSSNGTPWVIGLDQGIYYHDGNRWVQHPGGGKGSRLAISPNGTPWVVGTDGRIYHGTGSGWAQQSGEMLAKDIAMDMEGRPWVISRDNRIYYHNKDRWIEYPGNGRGLAIAISK